MAEGGNKKEAQRKETEKLILLVQKNRVLYDPEDPAHMDSIQIENIWKSIAKLMGGDDLRPWKRKWRNIRDAYMKYKKSLKTQRSGDAAKKLRKYVYADILNFLEPHLEERRTDTNVDELSDDETMSQTSVPNNSDDDGSTAMPEDLESLASTSVAGTVTKTTQKYPKKRKSSTPSPTASMEAALVDFIEDSKESRRRISAATEKRSQENTLLENYAVRLQKLPPDTRSFVELQLAQIFFNAENHQKPGFVSQNVTPLPNQRQTVPALSQPFQQRRASYEFAPYPTTTSDTIDISGLTFQTL